MSCSPFSLSFPFCAPCLCFTSGLLELQVLPDVLHVCELGLRGADAVEDAQLEATLSLLPLVGAPPPLPTGLRLTSPYPHLRPEVVEQAILSSPAFVSG